MARSHNEQQDALFARAVVNLGDMIRHDYSLHCVRPDGRGCAGGGRKSLGNAPLTADTLAASHAVRFPGHVVTIKDQGVALRVVQFAQAQLTDDPPF